MPKKEPELTQDAVVDIVKRELHNRVLNIAISDSFRGLRNNLTSLKEENDKIIEEDIKEIIKEILESPNKDNKTNFDAILELNRKNRDNTNKPLKELITSITNNKNGADANDDNNLCVEFFKLFVLAKGIQHNNVNQSLSVFNNTLGNVKSISSFTKLHNAIAKKLNDKHYARIEEEKRIAQENRRKEEQKRKAEEAKRKEEEAQRKANENLTEVTEKYEKVFDSKINFFHGVTSGDPHKPFNLNADPGSRPSSASSGTLSSSSSGTLSSRPSSTLSSTLSSSSSSGDEDEDEDENKNKNLTIGSTGDIKDSSKGNLSKNMAPFSEVKKMHDDAIINNNKLDADNKNFVDSFVLHTKNDKDTIFKDTLTAKLTAAATDARSTEAEKKTLRALLSKAKHKSFDIATFISGLDSEELGVITAYINFDDTYLDNIIRDLIVNKNDIRRNNAIITRFNDTISSIKSNNEFINAVKHNALNNDKYSYDGESEINFNFTGIDIPVKISDIIINHVASNDLFVNECKNKRRELDNVLKTRLSNLLNNNINDFDSIINLIRTPTNVTATTPTTTTPTTGAGAGTAPTAPTATTASTAPATNDYDHIIVNKICSINSALEKLVSNKGLNVETNEYITILLNNISNSDDICSLLDDEINALNSGRSSIVDKSKNQKTLDQQKAKEEAKLIAQQMKPYALKFANAKVDSDNTQRESRDALKIKNERLNFDKQYEPDILKYDTQRDFLDSEVAHNREVLDASINATNNENNTILDLDKILIEGINKHAVKTNEVQQENLSRGLNDSLQQQKDDIAFTGRTIKAIKADLHVRLEKEKADTDEKYIKLGMDDKFTRDGNRPNIWSLVWRVLVQVVLPALSIFGIIYSVHAAKKIGIISDYRKEAKKQENHKKSLQYRLGETSQKNKSFEDNLKKSINNNHELYSDASIENKKNLDKQMKDAIIKANQALSKMKVVEYDSHSVKPNNKISKPKSNDLKLGEI